MSRSRSRYSSRSHRGSSADSGGHRDRRHRRRENRGGRRSRGRSVERSHRRSSFRRSSSRGRANLVNTYRDYSRSMSRSRSRSPGYGRRRRAYEKPEKTRCLGVFGLSGYTTERQILDIFSKYGEIERVNVVYDAKSGRSRGFCFVYFERLEDAVLAKESCSGLEIDFRRIRVDYSITERPHTPTPGIYKGRKTNLEQERYSRRRRSSSSSSARRRRRPRSLSRSSRGSRDRR